MLSRITAIFLATTLLVAASVTSGRADEAPKTPAVQLIIDYGDGVQKRFVALAWKEGMTVLDALEAAQKHPRGIKIEYRGKGATAFLTKIDDLENEGSGRNWIFRVNDELAKKSFAASTVKAADTILWSFGEYR